MVRAAALIALGLALTAGPGNAQDAPEKLDPAVQRVFDLYRPEIEEVAQMMYFIGACEAHIEKSDVDYYIKEFMTGEVADGISGAWQTETQNLYSRLYTEGRKDAAKLNFDQTQCQRVADARLAAVNKAVAARKAKQAQN